VVAFFLRPSPPAPPVVDAEPAARPPPPTVREADPATQPTAGGSYDGRVVDPDGRGVADADVMLVAAGGSHRVSVEGLEGPDDEPLEVPVFQAFQTAARTKTNDAGLFRLTAGDARVLAIFAYAKGFTPTFKAHTADAPLLPGRKHEIRLERPGWLRGRVVDAATQEGVPGALVTVYLQGKANQETPGPEAFGPGNQFGAFQTWVVREVGSLVWGIEPTGNDAGFSFPTATDGTFAFGPLTSEAQLEVVVTHPEYAWTDFDPTVKFPKGRGEKPDERVRRLVVPAGETVERTYPLVRGREVNGRVIDQRTRDPIEGVVVSLDHVTQYHQHHWYRVRARTARTDADGRFHLAGLSFPPYVLRMEHPSFDTEHFHGVKDGPEVATYQIEAGGWIDVVVEGEPVTGERGKKSFQAEAHLQPAGGRGPTRRARVAVRDGRFSVEKVKPGAYSIWLTAGDLVSAPVAVTVAAERGETATVTLSRGGGFGLSVRDASGAPVDPVTVEIEVLDAQGGARRAGAVVARAGRAQAAGLLPGRYRAAVRAPGYASATSEPFEVRTEGAAEVPAVTLVRQSYLQIAGVRDAEGGAAAPLDLRLEVTEGEGKARVVRPLDLGRIPVAPGKVTLVAVADDGRRFERTFEVAEGKTETVEIVLAR
jgi:hypothetical protein